MPDDIKIVSEAANLDEWYFTIWKAEQEHSKIRWTVSTFFFSTSFAILGFSFQADLSPALANLARISGLMIYWFAFFMFLQFRQYTKFLRSYLRALENHGKTSLNVQIQTHLYSKSNSKKLFSATKLLFYFGIIYALIVLAFYIVL